MLRLHLAPLDVATGEPAHITERAATRLVERAAARLVERFASWPHRPDGAALRGILA